MWIDRRDGGGWGGARPQGGQLREIFSSAMAEDCVCHMVFMSD